MQVQPDTTNVSVDIRAMTAAGAALAGKLATDFMAWYRRDGAKTEIALSDLAALTTAHTDGGLKEIGDGWYRLDVPDAAFADGANRVAIGGAVSGGVVLSAPVVIVTAAIDEDAIAEAIDTSLSAAHGEGSWQGGISISGQTIQIEDAE